MKKEELVARLEKLTKDQLEVQILRTEKMITRKEKLEITYREINEKNPNLKKYNLQNYRTWQNILRDIKELKEAVEIGKELLNR